MRKKYFAGIEILSEDCQPFVIKLPLGDGRLRLLSSASYDRLIQRSPVIIIFQRLLFAYVTTTNSR